MGRCFDSHFTHYYNTPLYYNVGYLARLRRVSYIFFLYLISAAIDDAAAYGVRTLSLGFGLAYSLVDNQIAQVHSSGLLECIHTLSSACLDLTLHPRHDLIISQPLRIRSLPAQPIRTFLPSPEVAAAMNLHRSVIVPTSVFIPSPILPIHPHTLASMLPF